MKISEYLRDKLFYLTLLFVTFISINIILVLFNSSNFLIIFISIIMLIVSILIFIIDFLKRKKFYDMVKKNIDNLDQKYLITDIISNSNFCDGQLMLDYLYEINKSTHEMINNYKYNASEFREYLELWCHEIKTPVATSKMIIENNKTKVTKSINEELEKIENYIEQVLFYSKSDDVNKDYIIKDTSLSDVISNVLKKNKKDILAKKIKIDMSILSNVKSDAKWLEFIINQIIVNSIKYSKDKDGNILIYAIKSKNFVSLFIEDNGIGISEKDISKVFEKGFTGENGRKKYNSTGIGLYLCRKLCDKLGYSIKIESILNEKTIVSIVFPNSSMITNITEMKDNDI